MIIQKQIHIFINAIPTFVVYSNNLSQHITNSCTYFKSCIRKACADLLFAECWPQTWILICKLLRFCYFGFKWMLTRKSYN